MLQKDAKTQRITSQIELIEQELAQLTLLEVEQRDMRLDTQMVQNYGLFTPALAFTVMITIKAKNVEVPYGICTHFCNCNLQRKTIFRSHNSECVFFSAEYFGRATSGSHGATCTADAGEGLTGRTTQRTTGK